MTVFVIPECPYIHTLGGQDTENSYGDGHGHPYGHGDSYGEPIMYVQVERFRTRSDFSGGFVA